MTGRATAFEMAHRISRRIEELLGTAAATAIGETTAFFDRSDAISLSPPGLISPNGSCRLIQAADGWLTVNLPRQDDLDLVPAWIGCDFDDPPWEAIAAAASVGSASTLAQAGARLGLAVACLDEARGTGPAPRECRWMAAGPEKGRKRWRVLDLSTLWAGPLCAGMLSALGHDVVKVESRTRPDPVSRATPALDRRLNGGKRRLAIDFTADQLEPLAAQADIIVSSARARAFEDLGLTPQSFLSRRPGLIWIAITGYGWSGDNAQRVGFGDDTAVAGGLVDWVGDEPHFAGDALSDPLSGFAAGLAALEAMEAGGGVFVDIALSRAAAQAVAGL